MEFITENVPISGIKNDFPMSFNNSLIPIVNFLLLLFLPQESKIRSSLEVELHKMYLKDQGQSAESEKARIKKMEYNK